MVVFVINGYPMSGKDEVIRILELMPDIVNFSTIDIPKEIAVKMGWDGSKSDENREMLSNLKKFYNKYFDGTKKDIKRTIQMGNFFMKKLICIVSREPEEIEWIQGYCKESDIKCYKVCVKSPFELKNVNNSSDSDINNITYDIIINNDGTLKDLNSEVREKLVPLIENGETKND